MTLGDKLAKLRKENNYTQEQLADLLEVSRQAISKWESNLAYPETDKLIRLSKLFHCSLDYLLNDEIETNHFNQNQNSPMWFKSLLKERKSQKTILGMPLWHIGKNAKGFIACGLNAKGVIAFGLKAKGLVSFGMFSMGLISFGMFSLGLLSLGLFALGIVSLGCFAIGILAIGAISLGIISIGAIAIGHFSFGALAIGKYFAIGDHANAMIAIGKTNASGSVFQKVGELSEKDQKMVKELLDIYVPSYFSWIKNIIKSNL